VTASVVVGQALMPLANRRAASLDDMATLSIERFRTAVVDAVAGGWRVASLFGMPEGGSRVRLLVILADDTQGRLAASTALVGRQYPALTAECPQVSVFERELAEQCGVTPVGHPSLKPLRRHPPDHLPSAWAGDDHDRDAYPFPRIEGEEVHEVAVGPVHAGIIEPGHFRFQAYGERVLHLEVMLGYQHRGVERLLETAELTRAVLVAESIAGDTVIGHTSAYCGALEALARSHKSPRAQSIRGIALELERLANHLGDLGAIAGDVAFQPAAAFFGRMRGECLNLLMTISGNRYGRGLIRPGGVTIDITSDMAGEVRDRVTRLRRDVRPVAELLLETASVQSRLEGVGVVTPEACVTHGFVGLVARSCEVARDVRHDHPYGVFRFAQIPVSTAWAGDVLARTLVRWLEVQRSLEFVAEQVTALPAGPVKAGFGRLMPNEIAVAMEEGWRGEIVHVAVTDEHGNIRRHKVTDPSLHNWTALSLALPGNQISDFPLCNKSFNLSYAGHDL
jgi:Ni,Fe-hydrogenase III large subunit